MTNVARVNLVAHFMDFLEKFKIRSSGPVHWGHCCEFVKRLGYGEDT